MSVELLASSRLDCFLRLSLIHIFHVNVFIFLLYSVYTYIVFIILYNYVFMFILYVFIVLRAVLSVEDILANNRIGDNYFDSQVKGVWDHIGQSIGGLESSKG